MGREYEEERLFSEKLDRLLAGEDVLKEEIPGDDLRSALDFAQKIVSLRAVPTPQYSANLKARLLRKLQEREERRTLRQGWFWQLIPTQPLFQALAVIAIVFVVGGILWATMFRPVEPVIVQKPGITPPVGWTPPVTWAPAATTTAPAAPTTAAAAAPVPTAAASTTAAAPVPTTAAPATYPAATQGPYGSTIYLRSSASTDKDAYLPGEPVKIRVDLKNVTSQPVMLKEFPPVLSLMQSDTQQPVYTFGAGETAKVIAPGQTLSYNLTWDQLDAKGRHVLPGGYYLEMEEMYRQGQSVQMQLSSPVSFQILPSPSSSGGTGKPIEGINRPLTVNGITVTVQQLEFTARGVTVSAFITPPPDYVLKQDKTGLDADLDYRTQARYSVDGSWFQKTEPSLVEYFASGMKQTWFVPLPPGTEVSVLNFTLDNIAGWAGPWEFVMAFK
jgi:hypothetical protein